MRPGRPRECCVAFPALVFGRTSVVTESDGAATDAFLRLTAERAHLDFVPLFVPHSPAQLKDRLREDESFADPAELDRSTDRQYHSSGWGINE